MLNKYIIKIDLNCFFTFLNMATRKFIITYVAHTCTHCTVLNYNVACAVGPELQLLYSNMGTHSLSIYLPIFFPLKGPANNAIPVEMSTLSTQILVSSSIKTKYSCLEEWLISGLGPRKSKMRLEHHTSQKSKGFFKK